jgi:hypothetical protein
VDYTEKYTETQKKIRQMLDCAKNLQCTIDELSRRMQKVVEGIEDAYDDYPSVPKRVDDVLPQINAAISDSSYLSDDMMSIRRQATELQWDFDDDEQNQREFDAWVARMAVMGSNPDRPF